MSPYVRELYEYAYQKYPEVARHLSWLDQEIADHQTEIMNIIQTRLAVLKNLQDGIELEAIVNPLPPQKIDEYLYLHRIRADKK